MVKIKVQNIEPSLEEPVKVEIEEDESPEPIPEIESKPLKQQKMVSCPNCNKEMLQKTYRYYHSLKCKPTEPEPTIVIPRPEKIEVSFDVGRKMIKNDRIKRLISTAF